MKLNILIF